VSPSLYTLLIAIVLSGAAAFFGVRSLRHGKRSRFTVLWMLGAFVAQCAFLGVRGELRGQCPLGDWGEILVFIAWSLTIFYLVIGPTYRVSLLGVFTAPVVSAMQIAAIVPGMLEKAPEKAARVDHWGEMHAALSVLSYGALGLSAIAAVMFLVLNKHLKEHDLRGGVFKNLPAIQPLIELVRRLIFVGFVILTLGVVSSFKMEDLGYGAHFWAAIGVWVAYGLLNGVMFIRGMKPRILAKVACVFFVGSLIVFGSI